MGSLAEELLGKTDEIVQKFYQAWRRSEHPHLDVGEAALKNSLSAQLALIGEQLRDLATAEQPNQMWRVWDRLDPEKRVAEDIPIEEVVQEYRLTVDTVRDWIEERGIEVPFKEYSYFYGAIYELTAESVRRYARRQAYLVTKARGEYLAGIMHQLRTPLSSLSMAVDLMEKSNRPVDQSILGRLRRNIGRIRFLIDGVLRVERFRPQELPIRAEVLFPARLIDELITDHEQDAIQKGLRFEAHVNRVIRMTTDRDLFLDALGNLVSNAVKYTSSGYVIIEAEERQDDITYRVRDSGPGIPEDRQRSLFREVQPGSAGGAGIGLQIAHHAALALGGDIGVESRPGKGSTFWLRLPKHISSRSGES